MFFFFFFFHYYYSAYLQIQHYCLYSVSPTLLLLMMPRPPAPSALWFSNAKKWPDLQALTIMHDIPLMMPRLSVKFNEVYLGTFLSNCWDVFWTLTTNWDLDLEFRNINVMYDILSNYGLPFCYVWRNLLQQVLSNRREMIFLLPIPDWGLDLECGNLTLVCDSSSNYALSFGEFSLKLLE